GAEVRRRQLQQHEHLVLGARCVVAAVGDVGGAGGERQAQRDGDEQELAHRAAPPCSDSTLATARSARRRTSAGAVGSGSRSRYASAAVGPPTMRAPAARRAALVSACVASARKTTIALASTTAALPSARYGSPGVNSETSANAITRITAACTATATCRPRHHANAPRRRGAVATRASSFVLIVAQPRSTSPRGTPSAAAARHCACAATSAWHALHCATCSPTSAASAASRLPLTNHGS